MRTESRMREEKKRSKKEKADGRGEKRRKGKGAGEEGVCTAIRVGVNICCSACQGSIYPDGLTPGPLVEYR